MFDLLKGNKDVDAYSSLRIREYKFYLTAMLLLTIANQMQAVIIGWQIYYITHNPLSIGLIGLAEAVPYILTSLFAGHVADNYSRKKIIVIFVMVALMASCILLSYTIYLHYHISKIIWPIFLTVFFVGLSRGFVNPAYNAMAAQIVPREQFTNAMTWRSSAWQLGAVTGPAIGGLVYGFFGAIVSYSVVIVFIITVFIFYLELKARPVVVREKKESLKQSLSAGIKFVFSQQVLLSAITLDLFAVLFGGAVAVLPFFAGDVLKVGPVGLGFLRAAPFAGSILMGFWLAYNPPVHNSGKKLFISVTGFGLATLLFAISKNFYFSFIMLVVTGAFDNISVVIRATILQLLTPEHMRGRVSSVNYIFIGSSNEIGAFESGLAAKIMGLVPSVIFGGCMTMLIVIVTYFTAPKMRKFEMHGLQIGVEN